MYEVSWVHLGFSWSGISRLPSTECRAANPASASDLKIDKGSWRPKSTSQAGLRNEEVEK
jgi:hypothetical protein